MPWACALPASSSTGCGTNGVVAVGRMPPWPMGSKPSALYADPSGAKPVLNISGLMLFRLLLADALLKPMPAPSKVTLAPPGPAPLLKTRGLLLVILLWADELPGLPTAVPSGLNAPPGPIPLSIIRGLLPAAVPSEPVSPVPPVGCAKNGLVDAGMMPP
eukprot:scaffold52257_cov31-Tisochrysis_lutea.AAC.1